MSKETSSMEAIWMIRDARGLDYKEKNFLYTVASRGAMFATWQRAAADMGMSKDTFYSTRTSLLAKGVITVERRHNNTSCYTINHDVLSEIAEAHSDMQNDDSNIANEDSGIPEPKVTTKITKKETMKITKPVDVPSTHGSQFLTLEEDSGNEVVPGHEAGTDSIPQFEVSSRSGDSLALKQDGSPSTVTDDQDSDIAKDWLCRQDAKDALYRQRMKERLAARWGETNSRE